MTTHTDDALIARTIMMEAWQRDLYRVRETIKRQAAHGLDWAEAYVPARNQTLIATFLQADGYKVTCFVGNSPASCPLLMISWRPT
jgi:hypothetical protein